MCGVEVFLCKCVKTIPVKFGYLLIALRLYGIPSSSFVTQKCSNIEYNSQPCTRLFDMMSSSVLYSLYYWWILTKLYFLSQLSLLLKGTVVAPPDKFGKLL